MKQRFLLAISVLALSAVSQPIFAAETETPAPRERAAPVAERERAPARERQAQPARQQASRNGGSQQSSQSSSPSSGWTGGQAGGFGGGNAGGGGFADPVCLNQNGGLSNGCVPAQFTQSLRKSGGVGGGTYEYKWALGPYFVFGLMGDVSFGSVSASSSQTNTYASDRLIPGQLTTETYTNSVRQSTSGSGRIKFGVVPAMNTGMLVYGTAGVVVSKLDGTFTYTASNFKSRGSGACAPFNPMCATNVASVVNWSQTRPGFVGGGGVEFKVPAFGPSVVLVFDYSYAAFGSFNQQLPIAIATTPGGLPCVQAPSRNCTTIDTAHISSLSSQKFTVGAKIGL